MAVELRKRATTPNIMGKTNTEYLPECDTHRGALSRSQHGRVDACAVHSDLSAMRFFSLHG